MRRISLFLALVSLCLPLAAQRGGHGGGGGGGMRGGGGGGMHAVGGGMRSGGFARGGSFAGRPGGGFSGFRGGGFRQTPFRGNVGFRRGNFGFRGFSRFGYYPYYYPGLYGGYGWYDPYFYDSSGSYPYNYGYPDYGYPDNGYDSGSPPVMIVQDSSGYQSEPPPPPQPAVRLAPGPQLPAAQQNETPLYLIAFNDGVIRAVLSYRVEGAQLRYESMDHEQKQVPISTIDRLLSAQLNRERNVPFSLPR